MSLSSDQKSETTCELEADILKSRELEKGFDWMSTNIARRAPKLLRGV